MKTSKHDSLRHDKGTAIVTLSVGGTKIGAGAVSASGEIIADIPSIPAPETGLFDAVVAQAVKVVQMVGAERVILVGVSFPECVPPPARMVANPQNLPQEQNEIQDRIERGIAEALGLRLDVEVLHDAAAAILGEVSPRGTLPGCRDAVFVVWGTGIASGVVSEGHLYWRDPVVGQMIAEIGHLVVRNPQGVYEYRLTPEWQRLLPPERSLDGRICGPALTSRFRRRIGEDSRGPDLLRSAGQRIEQVGLVDINRAARCGNTLAIEFIKEAGQEMGAGLVPFIHYWWSIRQMPFIEHIIIGSGVAKLGKGVEVHGVEVLATAIRTAVAEGLASLGSGDYDTSHVVLSKLGYEREFLAFAPRPDLRVDTGTTSWYPRTT